MRKVILTLCFLLTPAFAAQQQLPITVDLGAPVYSTVEQSGGFRWVVRGLVYPAGTYATPLPGEQVPRPACSVPDDVVPIGNYAIFGEAGDSGLHDARYVVRLNEGRQQFVFNGIFEFAVNELSGPLPGVYPAVRLNDGQQLQAEFTPRSLECFGGKVTISPEPQ